MNYMNLFETCRFAFESENNILEGKNLGITSEVASLLTPERSTTLVECFQSCPYTASKFLLDLRIDGECVRARGWKWLPNAMLRRGDCKKFSVETLTAMVPETSAFVMKITVKSRLSEDKKIPLTLSYGGNARKEDSWVFYIPIDDKPAKRESFTLSDNLLVGSFETAAYAVSSSVPMTHFPDAFMLEGEIDLPKKGEITLYFSGHLGEKKEVTEVGKVNYEELIEKSFSYLEKEVKRINDRLPRLSSDNPALDRLYYRSLVTYILCRWEKPDLCTSPYFSTGSVNGACMCSYLWDYCGGLMLHPVYEKKANKEILKAYLRNDLTKSYALNPATSGPVGPWYQVNQEKIILMVYYHVLFTGEKDFLTEKVGDKTVIEWMIYHAYVADDTEKEVALYDYGKGGDDHLELRREYRYNGIMPDLNARRYMNYMRVYELTVVAGCPDERLKERAEALKEKLKTLWDEEKKWYAFIDAEGKRDMRYTVQMFKFLNSPVIGDIERVGLISHLNEEEFLSKFGLHSMSKKDPAFDQEDIDNGGGGICTHFTMQICAQLYEMGYGEKATDILGRVFWWGERMPYMGDSCAANMIANREDTPLQGDISSVSCAQMIFFYIFGIRADFEGNITVSPVKSRPAKNMKIENARLCGKIFSVEVFEDNTFKVCFGDAAKTAKIGEAIEL